VSKAPTILPSAKTTLIEEVQSIPLKFWDSYNGPTLKVNSFNVNVKKMAKEDVETRIRLKPRRNWKKGSYLIEAIFHLR